MIHGPKYGTPAWNEFRRGKVTASRFGDIMTEPRTKGVPGALGKTAEGYMLEVVASAITGQDKVGGRSAAMDRGVDLESDAIDAYAAQRFVEVGAGHILQRADHIICATPDGFVDEDEQGPGLLEVKCPESRTHLSTFLRRQLPDEYLYQVQGQMWVAERAWCDFISYDDRFPRPMQLVVIRVHRDEELIEAMAKKVYAFADIVQTRINALREFLRDADPEHAELVHKSLLQDQEEPLPSQPEAE